MRKFKSVFKFYKRPLFQLKFYLLYFKYRKYSMIPRNRFIENLQLTLNYKNKKGAIVECGVWKGGMIAAMAELLGNKNAYYLFDSFEGLPKAENIDGQEAIKWQNNTSGSSYFDNCTADESFAIQAMKKAGSNNFKIIKGWFENTLPENEINEPIIILRLDGDWYSSTIVCLEHLYPRVIDGGLIIIDDYYFWDGCSKAVHDFFSKYKLPYKIRHTENEICYIIKKNY